MARLRGSSPSPSPADADVNEPEPDDPTTDEPEADEPEADEPEADEDDAAPAPTARRGVWRQRRVVAAGVVAVVCLVLAGVLAFVGRSGSGGGDVDTGPLPSAPSTSVDTGGIDVDAPEGWTVAPVPSLGFGIAVPPHWEAVVLSDEMLNSLNRSDPAVTGFVEAAHAAAQAGSVFYAAGEDDQGRVSDLKLRAVPDAGIEDVAGLEQYAHQLAAEPGVESPRIERVDGAERPTVRITFRTTSQSEEGDEITARGVETLIAGPDDIVWSIIVTSEDRTVIDDLAPRIVDTFTLAPE